MEIIKATIDANYRDRKIDGESIQVNYNTEGDVWFNVQIGDSVDDIMTISCKLNELMTALGKAIESPEEF